jgi:tetratricopeptide (TPR) repeat protein
MAALGAVAGIAFLVLSGVTVWSLTRDSARRPTLTDKGTIVLADFDNKTGDPVFDDTLRQGLSVDLQQSPFVALISDVTIQQTLALMRQPKEARLTPEIARQICVRTASSAVLEGSISRLGSQYSLGLRARDCNTGNILDQQQVVAARREDVLNSLSEMSRKFRTRIGESLISVERHSMPLAEATTPSIEALKAYSTAMKVALSSSGTEAALPFFRRAVEIDPNFGIAHAQLGTYFSASGESVLAAESARKAWLLRERVSDRERFYIDFTYDRHGTGNLEKAYQTLELWAQTYPRRGGGNADPRGLLAGISSHGTGRFQTAIEIAQERIAEDPNQAMAYGLLASAYLRTDRFAEVESTLQRAFERKLETPTILVNRYNIAVLKGDQEEMNRVVSQARGKRRSEHWVAHQEALALARSGQLLAARRSSNRAVELALQEQIGRESAASYLASRAVWEAFYGNAAEGVRTALAALELSKGRDVEFAAGFALALSGDSSRSGALTGDLEKRFPEDTFAKFTYAPILRAFAALRRGQAAKSVELLEIARRYELAPNGLAFNGYYLGGLHSAYVRGEALVAPHRHAEAAAEFQKILDHRGLVALDPIGALAHLQLGRVFALSGDKAKAKAAYGAFLTLWKDADPDIPILKSAKAEYARL